jgi:hypothetical protein
MNARARLLIFLCSCAALVPAVVILILNMPSFGAHALPYGDLINNSAASSSMPRRGGLKGVRSGREAMPSLQSHVCWPLSWRCLGLPSLSMG